MSKQLLQKYINDKTIMKIKNLKLDIIGFDENHFSGTTDLSKDILTSYSSKNTIKIYLTATYNKPLKEWNILPECQMFWDIEDEQICKSILIDENNLDKFTINIKEFNEYVKNNINILTYDEYKKDKKQRKNEKKELIKNYLDKNKIPYNKYYLTLIKYKLPTVSF